MGISCRSGKWSGMVRARCIHVPPRPVHGTVTPPRAPSPYGRLEFPTPPGARSFESTQRTFSHPEESRRSGPGRNPPRRPRAQVAPGGLPGRQGSPVDPSGHPDGLADRWGDVTLQPVCGPQDRMGLGCGHHRLHPVLRDLDIASHFLPQVLPDPDVDPREQLHAVHRLVGRLLDRRHDGLGHLGLPAHHRGPYQLGGSWHCGPSSWLPWASSWPSP